MRFLVFPLLMAILAYCFAACGKLKDSGDEETAKGEFRFSEAYFACIGGSKSGANAGEIKECGYVIDADLNGRSFAGQSLRGMKFENCDLTEANFDRADLLGAEFINTKLDGASFRGAVTASVFQQSSLQHAQLQGAAFVQMLEDGTQLVATIDASPLTDAVIDSQTLLNLRLSDALAAGLIYEGADEPNQSINKLAGTRVSIKGARESVAGISGAEPLTAAEFRRLHDDLERLAGLKLKPGNKWFEAIFDGSEAKSLIQFVDERINTVIAKTDDTHSANSKDTVALNFGLRYWTHMYNERQDPIGGDKIASLPVLVDDAVITFDQPRVGLIALGPAYVHLSDPQIERLGTLVHESRHSDCFEEPSDDALTAFFEDDQIPEESQCNYPHVPCPDGALEGLPACDRVAWGAYGVAGVFFEKLARDCESCTETERQLALVAEKSAKSRVLDLDGMMSGRLGPPLVRVIE